MSHPTLRRAARAAFALSLALAGGACRSTTGALHEAPAQAVALDRPFSLAVGQSAVLDDSIAGAPFRVTFLGVTDDSRCPENAACVWEGDARVRLRLVAASASADTAAHTSGRFTPPPELAGFRVSVDALAPNARTERAIAADAYVATLRVARR